MNKPKCRDTLRAWSNRPRPKGRAKASSCDDRSRTFAAAPCHGAKLARDWRTTLRTFKNRPRAIQNRQPPETPRHGVFDREPDGGTPAASRRPASLTVFPAGCEPICGPSPIGLRQSGLFLSFLAFEALIVHQPFASRLQSALIRARGIVYSSWRAPQVTRDYG